MTLHEELLAFQEDRTFLPAMYVRIDYLHGQPPNYGYYLGEKVDGLGLRMAEVAVESGTKANFNWDVLSFWVGNIALTGSEDRTWSEEFGAVRD